MNYQELSNKNCSVSIFILRGRQRKRLILYSTEKKICQQIIKKAKVIGAFVVSDCQKRPPASRQLGLVMPRTKLSQPREQIKGKGSSKEQIRSTQINQMFSYCLSPVNMIERQLKNWLNLEGEWEAEKTEEATVNCCYQIYCWVPRACLQSGSFCY